MPTAQVLLLDLRM